MSPVRFIIANQLSQASSQKNNYILDGISAAMGVKRGSGGLFAPPLHLII